MHHHTRYRTRHTFCEARFAARASAWYTLRAALIRTNSAFYKGLRNLAKSLPMRLSVYLVCSARGSASGPQYLEYYLKSPENYWPIQNQRIWCDSLNSRHHTLCIVDHNRSHSRLPDLHCFHDTVKVRGAHKLFNMHCKYVNCDGTTSI